MRLPDDLGDVAAVHDGFRLRPSAALIDDVKHAR
jgi:hypothetical protein